MRLVRARGEDGAGLHWSPEPRVIEEPVPVLDEGLPVGRDPAATEQPASDVIESVAKMNVNAELLRSMAFVGVDFIFGYAAAMIVVYLSGRG